MDEPTRDATPIEDNYVVGGMIAGIIGGALMALFSMIVFPLVGAGAFTAPVQLMGALFHQSWGTISGFAAAPLIFGTLLHGAMSIGIGLLLGWLATTLRWNSVAILLGSVVVSMIVWAVSQYVIVPMVDPVMTRQFPAWIFALAHALYGIGAGGYLALEVLRAYPHAHEHAFHLPSTAYAEDWAGPVES